MKKEKIFISYATEDKNFAYWLDLKLRTLGYSTWIDKDKLLGGESFVEDIDKAIKNDSKCLVAIISKSSINKSAPRRERTLAASIGKELDDTFLIPVMLDSFKTSELSWDISDLSHISFTQGWADGLAKLSRKLDSINAPKHEPQLISLAYEVDSKYPNEYTFDYAWANMLRFVNIPDSLWRIETSSPFIPQNFPEKYPFVRISDNEFWAFDDELPKSLFNIINKLGVYIPKSDKVSDLNKIRKNLIRKSVAIHARSLGMYGKKDSKNEFYFPYGSTEKNRLYFTLDDTTQNWVKHSGIRRFSYTEQFHYHLSFSYSLVGHGEELYLHISPNFVLSDINDDPLDPARVLSRRKKLCKMMFNDAWLKRLMAVSSFLFGNNNDGECQLYASKNKSLTIESRPLKLEVLDN